MKFTLNEIEFASQMLFPDDIKQELLNLDIDHFIARDIAYAIKHGYSTAFNIITLVSKFKGSKEHIDAIEKFCKSMCND